MNIKDDYGRNVFHIAAKSANLAVMVYLLDKIDISIKYKYLTAKDKKDRTPLMIANQRKNLLNDESSCEVVDSLTTVITPVAGKVPRNYLC